MTPSPAEIAHAQNIISLFKSMPDAGVIAVDEQMLDLPHLKQATQILEMTKIHAHDWVLKNSSNKGDEAWIVM